MIHQDDQLRQLVAKIEKAPVLALDTEADSLHAYPEKVCLIQVSQDGEDELIDPLAGLDLQPLFNTLAPKKLLLHGADYDLRMLYRSYRFVPQEIFDTMLAARLLGYDQFGLNHLVTRELGVTLEKGPQKMNWAKRPLTDRMVEYARNDTHYLKPLADKLESALSEAGRLPWHRQICNRLIEECTQNSAADPDEVWRIKGSDRLPRKALSVLRALWHWREQEARAFNTPPFFVLDHDSLLRLASEASQHPGADHTIRIRTTTRRRHGLLKALQEGLSVPLSEQPHPRQFVRYYPTEAERKRFQQLKKIRDARAAELKLDPALIASKALLVSLSQDWNEGVRALMPWQRELLESGGAAPSGA